MCGDYDCNDKEVDRRSFLAGTMAAVTGITVLQKQTTSPQSKQPETRVLDDPTVQHSRVIFKHNGQETIDGYLARPKAEGIYPAVLVIAGNKISEEYIPNTCVALALAGFVGLAPNIFHPLPDSARTNEEYGKFLANHSELDRLDDIQAGVSYLRTQPFVRPDGMGIIGFCRGGREAILFGACSREIDVVVAFHPAPMNEKQIARLKVPVQVHHGTADRSVGVTDSQKLEKMLKSRGTPAELFLYEGADHGFLAYTRPFYKPDAAKLAWMRTIQFLSKHLK
jgi:carboxymethylenebutenolidase